MKADWVAAVILTILFFLSQFLWGRVLGVDYRTITDTTENLLNGMVARVGLTALIFLLLAIVLNRAWKGGVFAPAMPRLPGWMWVIPLLMVMASILRIADNDWSLRGGDYVMVLGVGTLLVGLAEETAFRGLVPRALRGSFNNEFLVMLISSLLFGVIHSVNILNGAEVGPTLTQIVVASISGVSLYVTMRLTGNILAPILLHALVDFSIFCSVGDPGTVGLIAVGLHILTYVVSLAAGIAILVTRRREEAH